MLTNAIVYMGAAVVAVPIASRLKLGSVLGYLGAGCAIGPDGLGLVSDHEGTLHVAEIGVVLMLYLIGLELDPRKLWTMRRAVFGGGGLQLGAAAIVLFASDRLGAAIGMALWGALVVGNIDNVIRPWISNRYAQVHPLITLVGAIAGVSYMGILGLLIGPLALSYFFELLTMYRHEYLSPAIRAEAIAAAAEESASAL